MKQLFNTIILLVLLSFTVTLNAQTINVTNEWKFIGAKCDIDVASDLNASFVEDVYAFQDSSWKVFYNDNVYDSTLDTIYAGDGFWIKGNSDGVLFIDKPDGIAQVKLMSGWNLVSAVENIIPLKMFFDLNDIDDIMIYTGDEWKSIIGESEGLTTINAGEAFWVKSNKDAISFKNLEGIENNFTPTTITIPRTIAFKEKTFNIQANIKAISDADDIRVSLLFVEKAQSGSEDISFATLKDSKKDIHIVDAGTIDIKSGENNYDLSVIIPKNILLDTAYIVSIIVDTGNQYQETIEDDNSNFDIVKTDENMLIEVKRPLMAIVSEDLNIDNFYLDEGQEDILLDDNEYEQIDYPLSGTFVVEILDKDNISDKRLSACIEIGETCYKLNVWDSIAQEYKPTYTLSIIDNDPIADNEEFEDANLSVYADFVIPEDIVTLLKEQVSSSGAEVEEEYKFLDATMKITLADETVINYTDSNSISKNLTFYYKTSGISKSSIARKSFFSDLIEKSNIQNSKIAYTKYWNKSLKNDWVGLQLRTNVANYNGKYGAESTLSIGFDAHKILKKEMNILSNYNTVFYDREHNKGSISIRVQVGATVIYSKSDSQHLSLYGKGGYNEKFILYEADIKKEKTFYVGVIPVKLKAEVVGDLGVSLTADIKLNNSTELSIDPSVSAAIKLSATIGKSIDLGIGVFTGTVSITGAIDPLLEFGIPLVLTNINEDSHAGKIHINSSVDLDLDMKALYGYLKAEVKGEVDPCCLPTYSKTYTKTIVSWAGYHKTIKIANLKDLGDFIIFK